MSTWITPYGLLCGKGSEADIQRAEGIYYVLPGDLPELQVTHVRRVVDARLYELSCINPDNGKDIKLGSSNGGLRVGVE